jgi:hypothetical protein
MCSKIATANIDPVEGPDGAIGSADTHVSYTQTGLAPDTKSQHFIVGPQRAVEQRDVGALQTLRVIHRAVIVDLAR